MTATATKAKAEKLFEKEITGIAGDYQMLLRREVNEAGEESITGRVAKPINFGDWREVGGGTKPSPTDVEKSIAGELGFDVQLSSRVTEASGDLVTKWVRVEKAAAAEPSEAPAEPVNRIKQFNLDGPDVRTSDSDTTALHRIQAQKREVSRLYRRAKASKAQAKADKEHWECAREELEELIDMSEMEEGLPLVKRAAEASANGKPAESAGPDDESWKKTPLAELGLSASIMDKLANAEDKKSGHRVELWTVGDLQRFIQERGQHGYSDPLTLIKGIGSKAAETIVAALDKFWTSRGQGVQQAAETKPAESPTPPTSPDAETAASLPAEPGEAEAPSEAPSEAEATPAPGQAEVEKKGGYPKRVRGQKKPD